MRGAPAVAAFIVLAWATQATAGVHGNVNVNYSTVQTDTEGQPSTSSQSLLQNYLLDIEGPLTPNLAYIAYMRATRIEQSSEIGGEKQDRIFTTLEPELQLNLRGPIYYASSGYRRTESWLGANFDEDERETSNFYFARLGLTPLRLPFVSVQFDRLESFDYKDPAELDRVDNSMLIDMNYAWQPLRAYYSFNYAWSEDAAGQLAGAPSETSTLNHLGRLDYNDALGGGKFPVSASYQVNSFETDMSGGAGPTATQLTGLNLGSADSGLGDPRFTPLEIPPSSLPFPISLDQTGRNIGFQLQFGPAVCDRIVLDLDQVGAAAPFTWRWRVYGLNTGDSSWSFLAEREVSRSDGAFTIDFDNSQAFSQYKVVNFTKDSSSPATSVGGLRAFNRQVAAEPSAFSISQSLNFNGGAQVTPDVSVNFNFFMDKLDREPDSYFNSVGNLFPAMFESNTGRPGGDDSSSTVNRTFGPSLRWLPTAWMAASFNYQRQDIFDSEGLNDIGGNIYSAIFNFTPLATLDTTLSWTRTEQDVRQAVAGQGEQRTSSVFDSYLASVTARLIEGLDWVGDFGFTTTQTESTARPRLETDSYFLNGAFNAQLTPQLFSTLSYGLNWTDVGDGSSVTKQGSLIVSYRPTLRLNTSYSISGSSVSNPDTEDSELVAQSVSLDWLMLPAIHLHMAGTHAKTWPEEATDYAGLAQLVYYVNPYADFQFGYTFNRSDNLVRSTTHTFNVFFNGRF